MTARPVALAASVAGVGVIALSVALVGVLLLGVSVASDGVADPTGAATTAVGWLGVGAVLVGILAMASAVGLWTRRSWAWVAAIAIVFVSVAGAVVALSTAGAQVPLVAGLVHTVATAVLLLAPSTRSALGLT